MIQTLNRFSILDQTDQTENKRIELLENIIMQLSEAINNLSKQQQQQQQTIIIELDKRELAHAVIGELPKLENFRLRKIVTQVATEGMPAYVRFRTGINI